MAWWNAVVAVDVAALRAGYLAVMLSMAGTVAVALVILTPPVDPTVPTTVAAALAAPQDARLEARRALAVARATAACMVRLGLAYDPIAEAPPAIPDAELDPVAWADRWGFGISTSVGARGASDPPDANDRRAALLPEPARKRYLAALHGDGPGVGGCHGAAVEAVYGLRDRLLEPLRGPLSALDRSIAADSAVASVGQRWDACIGAVGIVAPARTTLIKRMRAQFTARTVATASDRRRLAAVILDERRVAAAIARCEDEHERAMAAIRAPHEAEFVATYRSLLMRIGARIRAVEAAYPALSPSVARDRASAR